MTQRSHQSIWFLLSISGGILACGYAAYAGMEWLKFGQGRRRRRNCSSDVYLETLIPTYDIKERFESEISAPAEKVFIAACNLDLLQSSSIQAIFKIREWALGSHGTHDQDSLGLVARARQWGWEAMVEKPGHEIVFGAATQPWVARPVFRGLTAQAFSKFTEPDYVKIAWTLCVDPIQTERSLLITETRALATNRAAFRKFRFYWALVAPGTALIRLIALRHIKCMLEHGDNGSPKIREPIV